MHQKSEMLVVRWSISAIKLIWQPTLEIFNGNSLNLSIILRFVSGPFPESPCGSNR